MKRYLGLLLFTVINCIAQQTNVSISYGSTGLTALTYNGFQYLATGHVRRERH